MRQPDKRELRAMLQVNAVVLTVYFAAIRATPLVSATCPIFPPFLPCTLCFSSFTNPRAVPPDLILCCPLHISSIAQLLDFGYAAYNRYLA